MIRKKVIAGNWKMNKTAADGVALTKDIVAEIGRETGVDVVVCPPFTALESVAHVLEGQAIKLGAQNMHPEKSGAYTGEVSAEMLRTLYVTHVILGHSERRAYFAETDAFINKKVLAALANQLKPILCVGETLAERESGTTLAVVQRQVEGGLQGVTPEQITTVIIAYEPVWAIGTGLQATTDDITAIHAVLRAELGKREGTGTQAWRILYGGSVSPANAAGIFESREVDGVLVGGASLKAASFLAIISAGAQALERRKS